MADTPDTVPEAPPRRSARHFRPGSRIPAARRPRIAATTRRSRRKKVSSP